MHRDYTDIRLAMPTKPTWFDEHGVPRYCYFGPGAIADIYARECVLLLIECQACGYEFRVAMSMNAIDLVRMGAQSEPVRPWLDPKEIHYGDPPNVKCCPSGPTMNSIPKRVLEFWERHENDWTRHHEHEVECPE